MLFYLLYYEIDYHLFALLITKKSNILCFILLTGNTTGICKTNTVFKLSNYDTQKRAVETVSLKLFLKYEKYCLDSQLVIDFSHRSYAELFF